VCQRRPASFESSSPKALISTEAGSPGLTAYSITIVPPRESVNGVCRHNVPFALA
jgi:hypothetical protein